MYSAEEEVTRCRGRRASRAGAPFGCASGSAREELQSRGRDASEAEANATKAHNHSSHSGKEKETGPDRGECDEGAPQQRGPAISEQGGSQAAKLNHSPILSAKAHGGRHGSGAECDVMGETHVRHGAPRNSGSEALSLSLACLTLSLPPRSSLLSSCSIHLSRLLVPRSRGACPLLSLLVSW